jgi:two-component system cell cycle sensor histidine kinase/response regulator CckA
VSRSLCVLVVEDSVDDADLLIRELSRGYAVVFERVETADAMTAALNRASWDLIVSDFTMPTFSAPAALALLKRSGLDIPFIVLSGSIGEDAAVEALKAGANDFLAKGKLARLLPAVEREIRESKVREARRQAETQKRQAEEQFRALLESAPDGMVIITSDGRIEYVNTRTEALFGYSREELLERPIEILVPERNRAKHPPQRDAFFRSGRARSVGAGLELFGLRKDGTEFPVEISLSPADTPRGRVVTAAIRDITQRKQAELTLKRTEEQLRQAQKLEAVGRLAGGVAHDFNNLLSVILTFGSLLLDEASPADPARIDLEHIVTAAKKAATLTRQLLAFGRQQVLEPSVVDVNVVINGLHSVLRSLIGEGIVLTILAARDVKRILVDPGQLEQVIVNLVVNARDAMPTGGKLAIETANVRLDEAYAASHRGVNAGPYVMLAVTDTGTGMDAATQERIFEPFFTTKALGKGTGLGLSTVYGIVDQSGGHIWVYSELRHGTTFKVYFPCTDRDPSALPSAPPPPTTLRGTETVLLVEDDDLVRSSIQAILRPQGYNVLDAQNAGDALLVCEQFTATIHLLLTDVVMPRMTGRQLADRLAPLRPAMKVLYVSGYTENSVVHHGVLDSGIAFLQKPLTPNALLRKVRDVLDGPPKGPSRPPPA